jgi:hypothetical protein
MTISCLRPFSLLKDNQLLPVSRLVLITIMQFAEGLSDRQAAEAVRIRIDWKYVLVRRVARGDIPGATRKN